MKKFLALPLLSFLALPVYAHPGYVDDAEMIEAQEAEEGVYEGTYDSSLDTEEVEENRIETQEQMEERNQNSSNIIESDSAIDYSDRTRTKRARNALNTGSDASDDQ